MNSIIELVVISIIGVIVGMIVYKFMVLKVTHPDDSWMQDLLNDLDIPKPGEPVSVKLTSIDLSHLVAGHAITLPGPLIIIPPAKDPS